MYNAIDRIGSFYTLYSMELFALVFLFDNLTLPSHNGKKQNQDRLLLFYDHHARCILSGVFDGHGKEGHLIATFFRNTFLSTFIHQAQENKNIENAFRIAEQKLEENQDINIKQSGTTAMITLLSASMEGIPSFHSLNVGDSEYLFYFPVLLDVSCLFALNMGLETIQSIRFIPSIFQMNGCV